MRLKIELPIQASASFVIELPDEWDEMDVEERAQFILDFAENESFLCEDCAEKIVTDFEYSMDYDLVLSKLEESEFDMV